MVPRSTVREVSLGGLLGRGLGRGVGVGTTPIPVSPTFTIENLPVGLPEKIWPLAVAVRSGSVCSRAACASSAADVTSSRLASRSGLSSNARAIQSFKSSGLLRSIGLDLARVSPCPAWARGAAKRMMPRVRARLFLKRFLGCAHFVIVREI